MSAPTRILVSDLSQSRPFVFDLTPDAETRAAIAQALDLSDIRKLRFQGEIAPAGRKDWTVSGQLGATIVQPCVVTLAPVTTRIEEPVIRKFLADMPDLPEEAEIEMPEDETEEPLTDVIDLSDILTEALALARPTYPRAKGATLETSDFIAPGVTPMDDAAARPFAGLSALRDKLK